MKFTFQLRVASVFLIYLILQYLAIYQINQSTFQQEIKKILTDEGNLIGISLRSELRNYYQDSNGNIKTGLREIASELPGLAPDFMRSDYSENIDLQHRVSLQFIDWSRNKSFGGITDLTWVDPTGSVIGTFDVETVYRDGLTMIGGYLVSPLFSRRLNKLETVDEIQQEFSGYSKIAKDSIWISPEIIKKTANTYRLHFIKSVSHRGKKLGYLVADFDVLFFLKNLKTKQSETLSTIHFAEDVQETIYEAGNPEMTSGVKIIPGWGSDYQVSIVEPLPKTHLLVGYRFTYSNLTVSSFAGYQLLIFFGGGLLLMVILLFMSHRLLEPIESLGKTATELVDEQRKLARDPETSRTFLKLAFSSIIRDVLFISSHFLSKYKTEKLTESLGHVIENFENRVET